MMTHNDLQQKLLKEVRHDGMALATIPDNLKTVELCAAALKQCQDPNVLLTLNLPKFNKAYKVV